MKKFLPIIIVSLIVPQVSLAAWWNPFSWKVFRKPDIATQQLEKKIEELEDRVDDSLTTSETHKSVEVDDEVVSVEKEERASMPATTFGAMNNIFIKDYAKIHRDLLLNYSALMSEVANRYEEFELKKTLSDVEKEHRSYLGKLFAEIKEYLREIKELDPRSANHFLDLDKHSSRYEDIRSDFQSRFKLLQINIDKETQTKLRKDLIEYISKNKLILHTPEVYIQTALKFDIYDRVFKTKYSEKFRLTKTYQEAVVFANSFLLDMGVLPTGI